MKILVTDPLSQAGISILKAAGHDVDERLKLSPADVTALVSAYDVLLVRSGTKATAEMIAHMDKMKIIGRAGAGVDNIDVPAATKKGIVVMNTPGGNTQSTAEHTLAMIFAMARSIPFAHASLVAGAWDRKKYMGMELRGKTLGVIGFGRIGAEVARGAMALGLRVMAYDTLITPEEIASQGYVPATLDDIYANADIITVHVPLLSSTRHMITDEQLGKCKRGVCIVNCARGGIVDEEALVRALESGQVSRAALDVFTVEPPPPDHPLLHHPRVVVTPHIGSATTEAQENVAVQIAEQVVAALSGGALVGTVNNVPLR